MHTRALYSAFLCVLIAALPGCDQSAGRSSVSAVAAPPATVSDSLVSLGVEVDSAKSPRIDSDGNPYPADYGPYGARFEMTELPDGSMIYGRPSKLMLLGCHLRGRLDALYVLDNIARPPGASTVIAPTVLRDGAPTWGREVSNVALGTGTLRDAVASDVDGDGQDELVFVHVQGDEVRLQIVQGDDDGSNDVDVALSLPFLAARVSDVRIVGGDFDGDSRAELAIGLSRMADGMAEVYLLDDQAPGFAPLKVLSLPAALSGGAIQLVLEPGSVDYDIADELVVVVNEWTGSPSNVHGATRLHVFDDAGSGFAEIHSGPVVAQVNGGSVTAVVADVDIADLDGDGAGEILLAGVDDIVRTSNFGSPGDGTRIQLHVLVTLDDALRGFKQTAACTQQLRRPGNPEENPWMTAFVPVNAVDIDGDEDLEIQVDGFIFDRVPDQGVNWDTILPPQPDEDGENEGPPRNWAHRLVDFPFPQDDSAQGWTIDRGFGVVQIADVDGDGRQDVVIYRSGAKNGDTHAYVGIHGVDAQGVFSRWGRIEVEDDTGFRPTNPILVPVRAPLNGTVTETGVFAFESHSTGFTEPSIIAVLAAPPSVAGIDQNYDDCTTTWGLSKSTGVEGEREIKISYGFGIGFELTIPWVQIKSEGKVKILGSNARRRSDAYSLKRSVSFTTGPQEDSVVFSSIPMDNYVYHLISHPNVGRIGSKLSMSFPRDAVVRIAERKYYNAHVPAGSIKVDATVFHHTIGDVGSYPTAAEKETILDDRRSQLEDSRVSYNLRQDQRPVFDPVDALRGLQTEVVGVGQGSGSTEVALELTRESGESRVFTLGFEAEFEQTIGGWKTILGFGFEAEWSTKITFATGTNFIGTVGSIGSDDFETNQYEFGLFTYLQADPVTHREFHVVNYWVQR